MAEWRFPSNDYGEIKGINDSGVSMFRGTPLKSLAREICQNSLDAAIEGKTVTVQFNVFKIETSKIPGGTALADAFSRCMCFWKKEGHDVGEATDFFKNALKLIKKEECYFLRISDFNTTGLRGSRKEINTDWTNLTKSSGVSDKKGMAGGSYGIGKFAPFACSAFSTVFYSTYDSYEEKASQGVARLVTFTNSENKDTQGIGYYGNTRNTPILEEMKLDSSFSRKQGQYGTDIFIAGFRYGAEDWTTEIIGALLDGFLGAFWNKKLEVCVGDVVIKKENLKEIIANYKCNDIGYADKYYEVLISDKTMWNTIDFYGKGEIKLGLLQSDEGLGKVAMIRKTGMKIMDKDRLSGNVPFMGVMFIEGQEINKDLRLMENPEHNKWEPQRVKNVIVAKQILKGLTDFIKEQITALVNSTQIDSVDVVGACIYLPDEIEGENGNTFEEVSNDRVLNIDIKEVKQNAMSKQVPGNWESTTDEIENLAETESVYLEKDGDEEEWFHPGGNTENRSSKPGQPAHYEFGRGKQEQKRTHVSIEKMTCMCVNRKDGKYILMIFPNDDCKEGVIELFFSAETQRYKAIIKKATIFGKNTLLSVNDNKINDVQFEKGKLLKLCVYIDYYDYCSMEAELYATSK